MIYAGKNIQSSTDTLLKVTEEYFYHSIRNPKPEIVSMVRQLHIVKQLDEAKYKSLKRQLPYVVCATFNPPIRHTKNFVYTEAFILDIDHVESKGLNMHTLRKTIMTDERVVLLFASPSNDGLKVLFRLRERCYDAGLYKLFYKEFLHQKSVSWDIEQVVDTKTCDVARACFISIDDEAYYNPNAMSVNMDDYIDVNNTSSLFELKREIASDDKEIEEKTTHSKDPEQEILDQIKQTLSLKKKVVRQHEDAYVPQLLNDIMPELTQFIENYGVNLEEVRNIQYAKKMRFSLGMKKAEINLFYGKKGFSVVQSPRCGTSQELNAVIAELIEYYLTTNITS